MTYTRQGDLVTLEMTREDFQRLMLMGGYAAGAAMRANDQMMFWKWMRFANELNAGNPTFIPYTIPPEYSGSTL